MVDSRIVWFAYESPAPKQVSPTSRNWLALGGTVLLGLARHQMSKHLDQKHMVNIGTELKVWKHTLNTCVFKKLAQEGL